jgi:putative ABC transport system permease protein
MLRHVLRQILATPRRALFVVANMICGIVMVVLIDGYATSMFQGMRDGMIQSGVGHLQVFPAELIRSGNLQSANVLMTPEQTDAALATVMARPGTMVATPRVEASVMVTNGYNSQAGAMMGVDPDQNALINGALRSVAGRELFADDANGIILGAALADALGFAPGDTVTLLGTTVDGVLNAVDLELIGTVTTGVREADARLVQVTLPTARTFLMTEGTTRIAVLLEETDTTNATVAALSGGLPAGTVVLGWRDLAPTYGEVVDMFTAIFTAIKIAIMLFVAMAVANTIAICVVERTREIGIARAIGDQQSEIVLRFTIEGLILGLAGVVLGLGVAVVAAHLLQNAGFDMPKPPGSTVTYPLRFILIWQNLALTALGGTLVALLASFLPALQAARISVTEALRHA